MTTLFPYIDEVEYLRSRDGRMAQLIDRFGYIERPMNQQIFEAFVESIVSQQISTAAMKSIMERLRNTAGELTPQRVIAVEEEKLKKCGLAERKVGWIKEAAQQFADGRFDAQRLAAMTDAELTDELVQLGGVGVWTAEMLMLFALGRPNVLSYNDLIIRRSISTLYGEQRLTPKRFEHYKKLFSPYCSVASLYLWAYGNSLPRNNRSVTVKPLQLKKMKNREVKYSFAQTPFGEMIIASTSKGVCWTTFVSDRADSVGRLQREFPRAQCIEAHEKCHDEVARAIAGKGRSPLTFCVQGTPFERRVWRELLRIPYGITVSYAEIANRTGFTKAYRAVGNAVGANPVVIIIPCHRVIRADGEIGDYSAGVDKKRLLLDYEKRN